MNEKNLHIRYETYNAIEQMNHEKNSTFTDNFE